MIKSHVLLIIIFLVFGFFYRYFFATLAVAEIIWDMDHYHQHALVMMTGKLDADCCLKNEGYSLFLSGVYKVFGSENTFALQIVQVVLDVLTGLLLYYSARSLFSKSIALVVLFLYIINPYTASYVGLRLPEIVTMFYIAATGFILTRSNFRVKPYWWMSLGLVLGLLLFTRMQFFFFVFAAMGIVLLSMLRRYKFIPFVIVLTIGFVLASSYQLISQYQLYGKFSLTPRYRNNYSGFYINFFNNFRYNEISGQNNFVNPQYAQFANENGKIQYWEKEEYEKKYKQIFFDKLRTDWPIFVRNTVQNSVWLWDKEHLWAYQDPWYPADLWPLRILNWSLFILCFFGLFRFAQKMKLLVFAQPIFGITILLFLYITLTISLISNETRHSLPFYPLMILWSGYGITSLYRSRLRS